MTGTPPSTGARPRRSLASRPARCALGAGRGGCGPRPRARPRCRTWGPIDWPRASACRRTRRQRPQPPGLRPDHGVDPVDRRWRGPRCTTATCRCGTPTARSGMPLAFNWQAATFSLPALVGYLFPLAPRLHRAGRGHPGRRRYRRLRPVPAPAASASSAASWPARVRAERVVLRLAGLAHGVGALVGGMAVRRGAARGAGPASGSRRSPSSP